METKEIINKQEIEDIGDFFSKDNSDLTPEKRWEIIFDKWLNKIDQKKMMSELFELKLWFDGLEELFSSNYLETLVFKHQTVEARNYQTYITILSQVLSKIITLLKNLDFEKDKFFQNFEEFIVEKFLENYSPKSFPYLKDVYSPESWFYSLRTFMQNLRTICQELVKSENIPNKAFTSLKRLYRRELMNNSIVISLLKDSFIPKMDKIYQQEICDIISSIEDKKLKKEIGIFFILAFRILKINNFIEANLNKGRTISLVIPLILALKKHLDHINTFYEALLSKSLQNSIASKNVIEKISNSFISLSFEYKKIYQGELPYYFDTNDEKVNKRKILKNVASLSDMAVQQLIEMMAQLFNPDISGFQIFGHFVSREQMADEVKKKLENLRKKVANYLIGNDGISSSDIFFEINLFMETDLNYLLYKDWEDFLKFYNNLAKSDYTPEFKINLKAFLSFIIKILNEIEAHKKSKGREF